MLFLLLALAVGLLSGLRAFMSLVTITWAARLHTLHLEETRLAFLGFLATPLIATALGLVEFVTDQLPSTPSRKVAKQFIPRLLLGGFAGGAIGVTQNSFIVPVVLSLVGVAVGTYGGAALRSTLASAFKSDRPAAFLEDFVAIALATFVVCSL